MVVIMMKQPNLFSPLDNEPHHFFLSLGLRENENCCQKQNSINFLGREKRNKNPFIENSMEQLEDLGVKSSPLHFSLSLSPLFLAISSSLIRRIKSIFCFKFRKKTHN